MPTSLSQFIVPELCSCKFGFIWALPAGVLRSHIVQRTADNSPVVLVRPLNILQVTQVCLQMHINTQIVA